MPSPALLQKVVLLIAGAVVGWCLWKMLDQGEVERLGIAEDEWKRGREKMPKAWQYESRVERWVKGKREWIERRVTR